MTKFKSFLFATAILGALGVSSRGVVEAEEVPAPSSSYQNINKEAGTYDVMVDGTKTGKQIASISVAVWSDKDGQDDLKWYDATSTDGKTASAHFDIANHGRKAGTYNAHVYTNYTDGTRIGQVLEKQIFQVSQPNLSQNINGVDLFAPILPEEGELQSAIWSEDKDQDDLKWYSFDADGKAHVSYQNHKGYGSYQVHTYASQNGTSKGVGVQSFVVSQPSLNLSSQKISDTRYDITISDVPSYLTNIKVPVWTSNNGQDDIVWYDAEKVDDTTYRVSIPIKKHGYETGVYNAHIYGQNTLTDSFDGLATTEFTVDSISNYEAPILKVTDIDKSKGTFSVNISETMYSKEISSIDVAVWSTDNQSNMHWYSSELKQGRTSVVANLVNHKNMTGIYNVHAYVNFKDGSKEGFVLPTQSMSAVTVQEPATPKITTYMNEVNTYPHGQCTWGVKELAHWIPNYLSNAKHWADNARAKGFRTGTTPVKGAIAVWPNDGGGYGHVAYVTDVQSNHRIRVQESNYAGRQYISDFRGWFDPLASTWGGSVVYIYPN